MEMKAMPEKKWKIKDLLSVAADYLRQKEIENPRLTAEVLLAHGLKLERIGLYLNFDKPLTKKEVSDFRALIQRRIGHEPLQYITGKQEFWSLDFEVNSKVLVPRPETEVLLEHAIALAKTIPVSSGESLRVLDMCTGSGIVSVVAAREIEDARVWATDISEDALKVARRNADAHKVSGKIEFLQGDLWAPITNLRFDLILSNPPYVSTSEYPDLPPEVRDHEPKIALDGKEEGLHCIKEIIKSAPDFMDSGGWLMIEMSPGQTGTVMTMMDEMNAYTGIKRVKDYSRLYRVVMAQKS